MSHIFQGTRRVGSAHLAETSEIGNVEVSAQVVIEGASFVVYPLQLDRRIDLSGNMRYGWIKVEGRSLNAPRPSQSSRRDYLLFCDRQVVLNDMVVAEIDDWEWRGIESCPKNVIGKAS